MVLPVEVITGNFNKYRGYIMSQVNNIQKAADLAFCAAYKAPITKPVNKKHGLFIAKAEKLLQHLTGEHRRRFIRNASISTDNFTNKYSDLHFNFEKALAGAK